MTNSLNKYLSTLINKHRAYEDYLSKVTALVQEKTDFKCSIVDQPADGFCLLNEEDGILLAPLDQCLSIIYTKGRLTEDEHERISI